MDFDLKKKELVIKLEISEKLLMDKQGLIQNGPITIVAFGDSVTHGAVGPGEFDYETVYWLFVVMRTLPLLYRSNKSIISIKRLENHSISYII